MSDKDATTPRVFLARHGETEWTISGRFTGISEIELTENGEKQVVGSASKLVGPGKLIDPAKVVRVFVSPRKRAQKTFQLLFHQEGAATLDSSKATATEEIAEWGYGDYEGLVVDEIRALRKERGLDSERSWNIWRDGCEGGESAQQVADRLDGLIRKINDIQQPNLHGEAPADVVLVAHGHILRAFVKRWLKFPLDARLPLMMSPGAVGVLSYEHHRIDEPALMVGMSLP